MFYDNNNLLYSGQLFPKNYPVKKKITKVKKTNFLIWILCFLGKDIFYCIKWKNFNSSAFSQSAKPILFFYFFPVSTLLFTEIRKTYIMKAKTCVTIDK